MNASVPRRAILFINPRKKNACVLGEEIINELASFNFKADIFSSIMDGTDYDVAVSLGGDGTVLSAARTMSPLEVPIFPVNFGTFGFIAGVPPGMWREVFEQWLAGKAGISRRLMLEIRVERGGREVFRGCCLNDVVVSSSGIAKIINLRVFCGEAGLENVFKLGQYRSDGLIVSTPTGSTAYSSAAGGPIVDPELEALILNPICSFTFSNRPLVLPAGETVFVEVEEEQRSEVLLTVDGQVTEKLKSGDMVCLNKAPYPCLLIASGRTGFYRTLRTKFSWASGDEDGGESSGYSSDLNKVKGGSPLD